MVDQQDLDLAPVTGVETGAMTTPTPWRNASPLRGRTNPANPSGMATTIPVRARPPASPGARDNVDPAE